MRLEATRITERLAELADRAPETVSFIELLDGSNESRRLTAGELCSRAASLGAAIRDGGLRPGDTALLIATPPLEFIIGLFGCMWAGVIAVPIAFPRRADHLESRLAPVRSNAGATAIVAGAPQGEAESKVLALLSEGELPVISTTAAGEPDSVPQSNEVAYLQYTSGSTGEPRGVIVTQDALMANLALTADVLQFGDDSVVVSWCPLTHDMGLILGALASIAYGGTSVLMPPTAFVRRPLTWLRAMDRYGGTHGYSPNFGYDLCVDRSTPEERAEIDLSSVRFLVNGAEPVRRWTRDRFAEAYRASGFRPEAHTPGYGLAEATVMVSVCPADSAGRIIWVDAAALERHEVVLRDGEGPGTRELCACGLVAPGFEAHIIDPDEGTVLPPDRVGELWLRGPSVCAGYWNRPDVTEATFGATAPGVEGTYLRTGDLAFFHDGEVVICGRLKDLIIIHGRNLHPQDIEASAELAHEAVRTGGSAAFPIDQNGNEVIVVVAEVDGEPDESEVAGAVRAAVLREFEVTVADVLLVPPYTVPKTSSGKKQRSAARQLWAKQRDADQTAAP